MPRLTSNLVSMSLRMLYLSFVKMWELHRPAKTEQKGGTVPTRLRFNSIFSHFLKNPKLFPFKQPLHMMNFDLLVLFYVEGNSVMTN